MVKTFTRSLRGVISVDDSISVGNLKEHNQYNTNDKRNAIGKRHSVIFFDPIHPSVATSTAWGRVLNNVDSMVNNSNIISSKTIPISSKEKHKSTHNNSSSSEDGKFDGCIIWRQDICSIHCPKQQIANRS